MLKVNQDTSNWVTLMIFDTKICTVLLAYYDIMYQYNKWSMYNCTNIFIALLTLVILSSLKLICMIINT